MMTAGQSMDEHTASDSCSIADGGAVAPPADPREALNTTGRKILAAAQRLLADKGYTALTLENIAAEAGVNKASIRYSFGNKGGLVVALVDALMHEEFDRAAHTLPALPQRARLHAAMEAKRRMILSADEFRGFFDILPHALRTPELRERIAALYPWWLEQNLRWLGLEGGGPTGRCDLLTGLGKLMSAIVDGLSVQEGLDPRGFDPEVPLRTLEFLLERSILELEHLAESEAAAAGASTDASDR